MRYHFNIQKRIFGTVPLLAVLISALLLLASCASGGKDGSQSCKVYFPDSEYTSLLSEERGYIPGNSTVESVDYLLQMLTETPSDKAGVAAISEEIAPESVKYDDGKVTINFPGTYLDMEKTKEILVRASITETLTQDESVMSVLFLVEGKELRSEDGVPVGEMTSDSFINNTGVELNSYARANVTLFFSDVGGTVLKRYDEEVVYNTNISMEKFAVETLIGGPLAVNEPNAYPTLSPDAKLLSVTVKDRIAYANFDASVREEPYNVKEETALYSIVNTLTALPGIDKVQISIEGSTEGVFMDHMKLEELYERNDEMVQ